MLFHTPEFLFYFLPAALLLHRLALLGSRNSYSTLARLCLLLATLVFYGWTHTWWLLPFAVSVVFDFGWSILLVRSTDARVRRLLCTLSIVQNICLLGYFKYWDAIVLRLAMWFPVGAGWLHPHGLELPPGISFYTFESLSFVIDVYRQQIQPPTNPLDFFSFIAMFPRFVAGPIVRYRNISEQLHNYRGMRVLSGLTLFARGLFLKLCFADSFAVFTGYVTHGPERIGAAAAWLGTLAYSMQIYFDFSGYSLMAIGLGAALGFDFPDNFRRPYLAGSLQEFWRRWHISLSSWLRDYVYHSLGGNRGGRFATYRNLFLTMLLGGIWHGAGFKYAVWGAWHGVFLGIERAMGWHSRPPSILGWARTFLVVTIGWVFFYSGDAKQALVVVQAMAFLRRGAETFSAGAILDNPLTAALCVVGLAYCFVIEPRAGVADAPRLTSSLREQFVAACFLLGALILGFSQFTTPFLYFRF